MKKSAWVLLLVLTLMCAGAMAALATPYFRLMDPSHPVIGAGFLISPKALDKTYGVTDLALITHSVVDGTIIPESMLPYFPPVAWVPLHVGGGGSFKGNVIVDIGTSMNISPTVAALLLYGVDNRSQGWAGAVKRVLEGSGSVSLRIGGSLAGNLVKDGAFQSAKEMFPGAGIGEIISNNSMLNFGMAWRL